MGRSTEIIKLDADNIDIDRLGFAAEVIRNGGLVAFPTETVYGLGADALNEAAVESIFRAKGRPSDNPLIVHIADKGMVDSLVRSTTNEALRLMDSFWPGPLTIVMDKSGAVPRIVTAGLDTVAVRMPLHPVALALIKLSGCPIAAPSANVSGRPSPTDAKHVIEDLSGRVDVIIDAGPAKVGLESTVLDATVMPPVILRPGGITPEQLRAVIGEVGIDPALLSKDRADIIPKSPGMKYTHYSPKAQVIIIRGGLARVAGRINQMIDEYEAKGIRAGVMATEQTGSFYPKGTVISAGDRDRPETIAANLFRVLREFDDRQVQVILAEAVDNTGIGLAVMNRLQKAAGYNIIEV